MSANTETTGAPPKGYGECVSKCGRWAYMCGGGPIHCNACVPSSATYMAMRPDWTPPIAAPAAHVGMDMGVPGSERSVHRCTGCDWFIDTTCMAAAQVAELVRSHLRNDHGAAHVERRKVEVGQRRKSHDRTYTIFAIEGRCAFVCQDGDVDSIDGYVHNGGCCWESVSVLEDCELLADAPPEPVTAKDVFGEIPPGSKLTNDTPVKFASAPPAQEAPKAAPALEWSFTDDENRVHRFAAGVERYAASRAYWSWMAEQTGKPYAGPERLPRPQLAADWVEDCLPESDR